MVIWCHFLATCVCAVEVCLNCTCMSIIHIWLKGGHGHSRVNEMKFSQNGLKWCLKYIIIAIIFGLLPSNKCVLFFFLVFVCCLEGLACEFPSSNTIINAQMYACVCIFPSQLRWLWSHRNGFGFMMPYIYLLAFNLSTVHLMKHMNIYWCW